MRVLVTGASGSGQTSLAKELSSRLGCTFWDTDDFYWVKTDPPFVQQRTHSERHDLLLAAVRHEDELVLAGSIVNWGTELESIFDFIVFLYVPTPIRMSRLRAREIAKFGAIDPEFEAWALLYDQPTTEVRSLAMHEEWLSTRSCTHLRLVGADPVAWNADKVIAALRREQPST